MKTFKIKFTSSFITWLCSSWKLTNLSIKPISLGEEYFKNLWKPLRTVSDAKVTLLTSADRRSVSSPGLSTPQDSYIWQVMRKSGTHNQITWVDLVACKVEMRNAYKTTGKTDEGETPFGQHTADEGIKCKLHLHKTWYDNLA